MNEEQHKAWVADVTKTWPEPEPAPAVGRDHWAEYFARHRKQSRKQIEKGFEDCTDALAQVYHHQRRETLAEFEALSLEIRGEFAELAQQINEQMPALRREKQSLIEEERSEEEHATRELRLVASGRS